MSAGHHQSADRARRCLTSEQSRASQPHHQKSEDVNLAICYTTSFLVKLRPVWVPLNTRATSPTMDNRVHYISGTRPLHRRATLPTGQMTVQVFIAWPSTTDDKETSHLDSQSHYAATKCNVLAGHPSKHWPRSTLLNFVTKSGESIASLEKLAP